VNTKLLSAFDPLEWHCSGCGANEGVRCPEHRFVGLIQLNCPERIATAQFYGMRMWRETQTSRHAFAAPVHQPHGAA